MGADWPNHRRFVKWFREHIGTIKDNKYTTLKTGACFPERYMIGVIRYWCEHPEDPTFDRFCAYFSNNGFRSPRELSSSAIAELIGTPIFSHPELPEPDDCCSRGPFWFMKAVATAVEYHSPLSYINQCRNYDDLKEAIDWMFVESGREIARERLSPDEARVRAGACNRVSFEDCLKQAIICWEWDRWTILRTKGQAGDVAMSICIPLRETVYVDFLRGNRTHHEFGPDDFTVPSSRLVLVAGSIRPNDLGGCEEEGNKLLPIVLHMQMAWFALNAKRTPRQIRILSFAGTPLNRERLITAGFESKNCTVKDTGMEFFELVLDRDNLSSKQFATLSLLQWIINVLRKSGS